jgi:hypothetical protein
MSPQNPLSDIAELFGKEGPVRKDLNNLSNKLEDLTVELEELVKTLSKRAGVDKEDEDKDKESKGKGTQPKRRLSTKNPRDPYSDENTPRTLKNDFIGLYRGLTDSLINNPMRYVTGKSSLPENIDKLVPNEPQTAEDTINKITEPQKSEDTINKITENQQSEDKEVIQSDSKDIPNKMVDQLTSNDSNITKLEPKENQQSEDTINKIAEEKLNTTNKEDTPIEDNNNKVLNDMVGVLIDIRDDKSQKLVLTEATAIRQLLTNQNKITPASSGIEPNTNEAKQEDRELLAEAIARRLGEVLGESGIGGNTGLIPDFDRNNKNKPNTKPGGKVPTPKGKLPGVRMPIMPPGLGAGLAMAARIVNPVAALVTLGLGVIDASDYLEETDYGDKMNQGAGKDAEKAFRENVAPTIDPEKAGVTKDQALAALENGSERDIEKLGGVEALRKIAGVISPDTVSAEPFEQSSLRKYDYAPETSPKINSNPEITPMPETNIGTILNKISDQNTELKMFNMDKSETQMLAPIVSNKTINNTEQTFVGSPPTPHPSTNSFLRWQSSRSGYTD